MGLAPHDLGRWRHFGLQIGGQAADYVFLIMNPKGIDYLMRSQFTLGGDAAVAAGPVGAPARPTPTSG